MYSNYNCNRNMSGTMHMKTPAQPSHMDFSEKNFPPAMAYISWQYFGKVYEPPKALCQGTVFPELDLPFTGKRGNCP